MWTVGTAIVSRYISNATAARIRLSVTGDATGCCVTLVRSSRNTDSSRDRGQHARRRWILARSWEGLGWGLEKGFNISLQRYLDAPRRFNSIQMVRKGLQLRLSKSRVGVWLTIFYVVTRISAFMDVMRLPESWVKSREWRRKEISRDSWNSALMRTTRGEKNASEKDRLLPLSRIVKLISFSLKETAVITMVVNRPPCTRVPRPKVEWRRGLSPRRTRQVSSGLGRPPPAIRAPECPSPRASRRHLRQKKKTTDARVRTDVKYATR